MNSQPYVQCRCELNQLPISGKPLFRTICHCNFCQEFNDRHYGDIVILRQSDIALPKAPNITYHSYKRPEIVQRGRCAQCNTPVVEHLRIPLFPQMAFVPVSAIKGNVKFPEPAMHMFYHRRVKDIDDQIPKYSGYISSELSFMGRMIKDLIRTR